MDRYPMQWQRQTEIEQMQEPLPACAQPTDFAPSFTAEAWDPIMKQITHVRLEDFRGKWVILFFYSSDFTFV
jgi:hypothetical protein